MPISISGDGTLTGVSVGGLPDGIVDTDMLATSAVTTAKTSFTGDLAFNSGYGSAATAYGCRAWINFNGALATIGTGRGNGNMDAVTDNGTGDYTLNFTNDMPDANYCLVATAGNDNTNNRFVSQVQSVAVGSVRIGVVDGANANDNVSYVFCAIIR